MEGDGSEGWRRRTEGRRRQVKKETYWTDMLPWLTISGGRRWVRVRSPGEAEVKRLRTAMHKEGFFAARGFLEEKEKLERMQRGLRLLVDRGLHPLFIILFDEAWEVAYSLLPMMRQAVHPRLELNFDWYAWHVDPKKMERGFPPHRDRADMPFERVSFAGSRPGGMEGHREKRRRKEQQVSPTYATVWLPLTRADETNSCIHYLPASRDKNYMGEDATEEPERLEEQEHGTSADSLMLPCPADPGDVLVWSGRLRHSGGESRDSSASPRISIAFGLSCTEYEDKSVRIPLEMLEEEQEQEERRREGYKGIEDQEQTAMRENEEDEEGENGEKDWLEICLPSFPQRLFLVAVQIHTYEEWGEMKTEMMEDVLRSLEVSDNETAPISPSSPYHPLSSCSLSLSPLPLSCSPSLSPLLLSSSLSPCSPLQHLPPLHLTLSYSRSFQHALIVDLVPPLLKDHLVTNNLSPLLPPLLVLPVSSTDHVESLESQIRP
eukprot:706816-Hanusia_phi.AAC.5